MVDKLVTDNPTRQASPHEAPHTITEVATARSRSDWSDAINIHVRLTGLEFAALRGLVERIPNFPNGRTAEDFIHLQGNTLQILRDSGSINFLKALRFALNAHPPSTLQLPVDFSDETRAQSIIRKIDEYLSAVEPSFFERMAPSKDTAWLMGAMAALTTFSARAQLSDFARRIWGDIKPHELWTYLRQRGCSEVREAGELFTRFRQLPPSSAASQAIIVVPQAIQRTAESIPPIGPFGAAVKGGLLLLGVAIAAGVGVYLWMSNSNEEEKIASQK